MAGLTDEKIAELVNKSEKATVTPQMNPEVSAAEKIAEATTRRLLVIGFGDGGCHIATAISKKLPNDSESFVIAYNTTTRNMNDVVADIRIVPTAEDGAGKVRDYSKSIFKEQTHKRLLSTVQDVIKELGDVAYILVCTTADGGTGSGTSPMAAKLLHDNTKIPTLILGVYPSISEDATAQFNALQWESEVKKIGIPYFVMDNNQPGMSKPEVHAAVNSYAADIASLLAGAEFGNTDISMIDNRNLFMLLNHLGGRLVAAIDTGRPATGQSLDDYVDAMLKKNYQPVPSSVRGIGIFVKGPDDILSKLDTGLTGIQEKYGNAVLHFSHIEVADKVKIAVLLTGNGEAVGRITEMKARYDDIMDAQVQKESILGGLLAGASNPLGNVVRTTSPEPEQDDDIDDSALDL